MVSGRTTSWQIDGETMETVTDFIFLGSKITADGDCNHEIKMLAPWRKSYDQPRKNIKKQRHYFANKGLSSQSYDFCSSHLWMWELDYKRKLSTRELMLLNCGVGKDYWESLGLQEIKPVNPKGNQHWIFIGTTHAEVDSPILWPPDVNNWVTWKDPDAGKDWRQEEKGTTEDDMVGSHHRFKGYEFEQAPGVGNGQGSLVYWSPWGHKESHMTEWLNRSELPSKGFPWWLR